jgi:hypothetical protein
MTAYRKFRGAVRQRRRGMGTSMRYFTDAPGNAMMHTTHCRLCQKSVSLETRPAPETAPAWRMFDCPHCLKTNFLLLTARVLAVSRGEMPAESRT